MARIFYPDNAIFNEERRSNSTWLKIQPKVPSTINFSSRGSNGSISASPYGDCFYFIIDKEFTYSVRHDWKEYVNIIGEIKELGAKLYNQGGQLVDAASVVKKSIGNSNNLTDIIGAIGGGSFNVSSIANKNDNPVMYENSSRKSIMFDLKLAAYKDPLTEVFAPIDKLQELSSASNPSVGGIGFTYPYIFDVSLVHGDSDTPTMFYIKNAVISSLTPTFYAPYIKGYPSMAEVQIQFDDIDPLYKDHSWGSNGKSKVNVGYK